MARIILEGMDHDNVGINLMAVEQEIPKNATLLITTWGNYKLALKGQMRDDDREPKLSPLEAKLETHPVGMFESVQTALVETEEGFFAYSWANKERYQETISRIVAMGGFPEAFAKIAKEPSRFYQ
jgi:hypothetical protein